MSVNMLPAQCVGHQTAWLGLFQHTAGRFQMGLREAQEAQMLDDDMEYWACNACRRAFQLLEYMGFMDLDHSCWGLGMHHKLVSLANQCIEGDTLPHLWRQGPRGHTAHELARCTNS